MLLEMELLTVGIIMLKLPISETRWGVHDTCTMYCVHLSFESETDYWLVSVHFHSIHVNLVGILHSVFEYFS